MYIVVIMGELMLEIANITKEYELKDQSVTALNNVSMKFRASEFVAILGPSGCGKTTLLNIIGGLDRYTSGDLIIDGISTKEYKDKDWDNYRNHRVGFVFQSYNLIPHQTVLENVELALTISGIKKKDRRARAIEVLEKVGLGDKLKSKPNQLSGGQMQRVAIARALVNDPEIILADEPTGALDSKTSVQIMEILKEVSRDRLVIMVTHNPDLASEYSSRIIRMLDGEVKEDTNAVKAKEKKKKKADATFQKTEKKKSMSFFTALSLSLKNLLTKKGRTIMVSLAGSIGIIGIALILAVSAGMTNYINNMQSESLSSYPVAVSTVAIDIDAAMNQMGVLGGGEESNDEDGVSVYDQQLMLINMGTYNYMNSEFVQYVQDYYADENKSKLLNDYMVSYASDMHLVTERGTGYEMIDSTVSTSVMDGSISSYFFQELDKDYVLSLYDIKGTNAHYPTGSNEVALVLSGDSIALQDLQKVGIRPSDGSLKYDNVIGKTYKLILNDRYYDPATGKTRYLEYNQTELAEMYSSSETVELTISCVLQLKDEAKGSIFSNGVMYTDALAEYYRDDCINSDTVQNFKTRYLDAQGNFIDATLPYAIPYVMHITELTGPAAMMFTYISPQSMQSRIEIDSLGTTLSDAEIIDIYLQVYGASSIPTGMYFYTNSFDAKDDLAAMIDAWNQNHNNKILLTDSSQLLTDILGTLVNTISYVLIAFAAISLVVSSVMIGIITYTSVIERTKEIGVLRSVGASKRDVSRVFNAETTIIGLTAGGMGIVIALLLIIPINIILKALTSISGLAVLPIMSSVSLIVISVVLTFIAGLIPARIAAKKDPVAALRSE